MPKLSKPPKGRQFADEVEPPRRESVLLWNGSHVSLARLQRGNWIAHSEDVPVCDPWEKPVVISGVTHWQLTPEAPQ
jgi:hypothetical protein